LALHAHYYDGRTPRRQEVLLSVAESELWLQGEGIDRREALASVEFAERLGAGPRLVRLPNGAYCEVRDHAAFEAELKAAGLRPSGIEGLQRSWRIAVASTLIVMAVAVLGYIYGLPVAARVIAERLPKAVDRQLSRATLASLDRTWLSASKLDASRREQLVHGYQRLDLGGDGQSLTLEFRSGGALGPNAFALPDGTVVVFDELVNLAKDDDEIYAVLAHEQGHVHYQHGLRMLLQGSVVAAVMTAWIGDVSTLLALLPTAMLQTRYSREFESQADAYAVAQLRAHHIPPSRLADMLERMVDARAEKAGGKHEDGGFLSSHPATQDRIRLLREAG